MWHPVYLKQCVQKLLVLFILFSYRNTVMTYNVVNLGCVSSVNLFRRFMLNYSYIKRLFLVLRIKRTTIMNTDFHGYASKVKSAVRLTRVLSYSTTGSKWLLPPPPRVVEGWGLLSASLRGGWFTWRLCARSWYICVELSTVNPPSRQGNELCREL